MELKIDKKELFYLVLILVVASFFRLWKLNTIPPGIYPDEAINGNEAIFTHGKVFYKENNGREGLFINIISVYFALFGKSVLVFRLVPATCGILAVFGIYLLTKELFEAISNKQEATRIALLASFFVAVSFWPVNFARIVFRANLVPLISVFAFYFIFRGLRKESVFYSLVAGVLFGLGLYTYTSFRLLFLLLPLIFFNWYFLIWPRQTKAQRKKVLHFAIYFSIAGVLVSLPLLFYFLKNPQDFAGRLSQVMIFSQKNPVEAFFKSLISHLAMFNFQGDYNWRHNISGFPLLFWPVGILFLAGLFYSIKEIYFGFKKKQYSLFAIYSFLISWWFMALLPSILTYEAIPHALRSIGAIPPTFIFAGLGGALIFEFVKKKFPLKKGGFNYYLVILSSILLAFSFVFTEYTLYFELWARNPQVKNAFSADLVEVGNYLNSLPDDIQKYVIVNFPGVPVPYPNGIPMSAQTPMLIEAMKFERIRSVYLTPQDLDKGKLTPGVKAEIVLMKCDSEVLGKLALMFPQGYSKEQNGICIYKIE